MRGHSSGFTLVEIMIVLLLLGIVLSAAIPSMNSTLDGMKLDGAAQEVVYAIQYVRSLSIKEGTGYGVKFFPDTNNFECYDTDTDGVILNPVDKKPYEIDFDAEGHLQGIDLVSAALGGNQVVEFNSLGELSVSGSVVLGYSGARKTVNVSAPLGRITVQ